MNNTIENIISRLKTTNIIVKSESKLKKLILRKSFKRLILLANWYKDTHGVTFITQEKLNDIYIADILLRRVINKYLSAIEVSMHSVLLNHFFESGTTISRKASSFELEHMDFHRPIFEELFQVSKNSYREWDGRAISIETVIEDSSLGLRNRLYFFSKFDKSKWTPFLAEPSWTFLDTMRKMRNRISHRDLLCVWISKKELLKYIEKIKCIVTVTKKDNKEINKYINIVYN